MTRCPVKTVHFWRLLDPGVQYKTKYTKRRPCVVVAMICGALLINILSKRTVWSILPSDDTDGNSKVARTFYENIKR